MKRRARWCRVRFEKGTRRRYAYRIATAARGFFTLYWYYRDVPPRTSTSTSRVESAGAPLFGRLDFPSPYFRGEFGSRGSRGSFATSGSARTPPSRAVVVEFFEFFVAGERRFGFGRVPGAASPEGSVARRRDTHGALRGDGRRRVRLSDRRGRLRRPSALPWRHLHLPARASFHRRMARCRAQTAPPPPRLPPLAPPRDRPASRGGPIVFTPRQPQHAAQNHGGKHRHISARRAPRAARRAPRAAKWSSSSRWASERRRRIYRDDERRFGPTVATVSIIPALVLIGAVVRTNTTLRLSVTPTSRTCPPPENALVRSFQRLVFRGRDVHARCRTAARPALSTERRPSRRRATRHARAGDGAALGGEHRFVAPNGRTRALTRVFPRETLRTRRGARTNEGFSTRGTPRCGRSDRGLERNETPSSRDRRSRRTRRRARRATRLSHKKDVAVSRAALRDAGASPRGPRRSRSRGCAPRNSSREAHVQHVRPPRRTRSPAFGKPNAPGPPPRARPRASTGRRGRGPRKTATANRPNRPRANDRRRRV